MSSVPIRLRLTVAFALAMVLLLAGAAAFVHAQLAHELDEGIEEELAARATAVAGGPGRPPDASLGAPEELEDGFAQVLSADGRLIDASPGLDEPVLDPDEAGAAAADEIEMTREVEGVDQSARILAAPLGGDPGVVVVGKSVEDREETLDALVGAFAIGGPLAVILASLLGYALASSGLRPVEAMRRRAGEISLERGEERLPLPAARDEIRRLGETLNEMLARLRASFERERRFVADASHELRNPIAVIKAELDAALASDELGAGARAGVAVAAEECDNLAALAEDLLVLARAADGALPVHRERLDVTETLEGVRIRFEQRARERGRAIRVEGESGLSLHADALRLRQALGNLVDNALRHGSGDVVLSARTASGAIEVAVSDSGPGFEDAIAARAFERFTRGDEARAGSGAGLGLAIVRAIADAHDGTASIDREGPGGATVRLRIPVGVDSR